MKVKERRFGIKCLIFLIILILALIGTVIGLLVAYLNLKNDEITTEGPTTTTVAPPIIVDRLSSSVIPSHYDLVIEPIPEENQFTGTVEITVKLTESVNEIKLHSNGLNIINEKFFDSTNTEQTIKNSYYDDRNQFHVMEFNTQQAAGDNYKIQLSFNGSLINKLVGFHMTKYRNPLTGEDSNVFSTKFEPTYARQAFPCFDEPNFKAEYTIKIIHDSKLIATSNMPQVSNRRVHLRADKTETSFERSIKMSTYLVAFIISDFSYTNGSTTRGTEVRVFSRPDQVRNTLFARDTAIKILQYYEQYFGIPYPIKKLDLIALPVFVSGAMENWGAITFRESNLLYNESSSSAAIQKRVVQIIAHELAHMWFGNLVTMDWWDDLWLNEGFASYNEYKGIDNSQSDWDIMNQFLNDDLQPVLELDALESSHPIIQPVYNPDQISEIFDTISYNKGASVLRMLENLMGSDGYQKGVRNYLLKYSYQNAKTDQFWDEMNAVIDSSLGIPSVKEFMDVWTNKKGFPVVTVTRVSENQIKVSQKRFVINDNENVDTKWMIPLTYQSSTGINGTVILKDSDATIDLSGNVPLNESIKFNTEQKGYYIVNYSEDDWNLLIKGLIENLNTFTPSDRSNLLFDASILAEAELISYEKVFQLSNYLLNEDNLVPWTTAYNWFMDLGSLLTSSISGEMIRDYINSASIRIYNKIGWEFIGRRIENNQNRILRGRIINLACYSGNENCLTEASRRFKEWIDTNGMIEIPSDVRSSVYKYGMQEIGRTKEWQFMYDRYLAESVASEKSNLLVGLTNVRDGQLLQRLISYTLDESFTNDADFFTVLQTVASNTIGRPLVWNFIRENWTQIVARFGLNNRNLGRLITSVCGAFTSELQLEEIEAFFAKYPEAGAGKSSREETIAKVQKNILWLKTNKDDVTKWLQNNTPSLKPWLNWRLDSRVRPSEYVVYWNVDITNSKFSGNVTITLNTTIGLNYIILHNATIRVGTSKVFAINSNNDLSSTENKPFKHLQNQYWIIPLKERIFPGIYKLILEFEGDLTESLVGLYKSTYIMNGETRTIATTQFQTTYARMAFPCFDEPQFKATFEINVIHDKSLTALSNMNVIKSDPIDDDLTKQITKFAKTVPMSPYLLALVVSDFQCAETISISGSVPIRICSTKNQIQNTGEALRVTPKILEYYAKTYFNIPYPLPKLDLIAIPDFRWGAMENWGLVTYRETALLYDPKESTTTNRLSVNSIIAHELAHMWFGNLVTMRWWEESWLNEGFATFMTSKAVASLEEEYEDNFINTISVIYNTDSSPKTQPIVNAVHDENEIQAIFSAIIYSKGATIIRMLEHAMGEDNFKKGIQNYMNKYSYKNTDTKDLLTELTNVHPDKLDLSLYMNTWINKKGFPCVTIRNKVNNTFTFTQEKFLRDSIEDNDYLWSIPLSYENSDVITWMTQKEETMEIELMGNFLPKFNVQQKGLYIVNYPVTHWRNFIKALNDYGDNFLRQTDRANLILDSFYLARSGRLSYDIPFELIQYIKNETKLVPWNIAKSMTDTIKKLIYNDAKFAYNYYIQQMVDNIYTAKGWDDAFDIDDRSKQLRIIILELACGAEHENCLKEASERFQQFKNGESIDPNLRSLVLRYGISNNGDVQFLWEKYNSARTTIEKLQYIQGIAATKIPEEIDTLLQNAMNETIVRRQDFFNVLAYIAPNPVALPKLWDFYRDNYHIFLERFTLNNPNLGSIIATMCSYFTTDERKQEVLDFYKKYPNAGAAANSRAEAIEILDGNIKWLGNYRAKVIELITKDCPKDVCAWNVYRLNPKIIPLKYDLTLQPNVTTDLFTGEVTIDVNVNEPTQYFIVHINSKLTVTKSQVLDEGNEIGIDSTFRYETYEFWVIKLKEIATPKNYKLTFEFKGSITANGLVGMYKSTYQSNGTNGLVATQFESTHARKAFPCFDEPSFRSTFKLKLIHDEKHHAISNMPIVKVTDDEPNGLKTTEFEESVNMVSYLLALVVSDFYCVNSTDPSVGKLKYFQVCATPLLKDKLEYSNIVGPKILDYFGNKYFEIEYPLPKMDMIAIPDFSAGAMENWGLVLYRHSAMLFDDNVETTANKMSICAVIAHELAHMWHGNLVTCNFWGELWLNEGFASYMEYDAVDFVEPEWKYWDLFVISDLMGAFNADSYATSQPIVRSVTTPGEMSYTSAIVYNKGASIIRMIDKLIMRKDNRYQKGIRNYLNRMSFKTAVTDDLLLNLSEATEGEEDLKSIMHEWLYKPGFPYLTLTRPDSNHNKFHIIQERFLRNGDKYEPDYQWDIPLSWYKSINSGEMNVKFVSQKDEELEFEHDSNDIVPDLIKFNYDQMGYYMINYPKDDWEKWAVALTNQDVRTKLKPGDRSNFIIDSFYLARADKVPYDIALEMTKFLVNEDHLTPWSAADSMIGHLNTLLRLDDSHYNNYKSYLRKIIKVQYERLKWNDNGDDTTRRLRPVIINLACFNDLPECLNDAGEEFEKFKNDANLRPNLKLNTLRYGIKQSNDNANWDFIWKKYNNTDVISEKLDYLNALSYTTDITKLNSLLQSALDVGIVRNDDFYTVLTNIVSKKEGLQLMWDFYRDNYEMLLRRLGSGNLGNLANAIANYFTTEVRKNEVLTLFAKYENSGITSGTRNTILENINSNINWMSKYVTIVGNWLEKEKESLKME